MADIYDIIIERRQKLFDMHDSISTMSDAEVRENLFKDTDIASKLIEFLNTDLDSLSKDSKILIDSAFGEIIDDLEMIFSFRDVRKMVHSGSTAVQYLPEEERRSVVQHLVEHQPEKARNLLETFWGIGGSSRLRKLYKMGFFKQVDDLICFALDSFETEKQIGSVRLIMSGYAIHKDKNFVFDEKALRDLYPAAVPCAIVIEFIRRNIGIHSSSTGFERVARCFSDILNIPEDLSRHSEQPKFSPRAENTFRKVVQERKKQERRGRLGQNAPKDPERVKKVVQLHHDGVKMGDIAQRLGMQYQNVYQMIRRWKDHFPHITEDQIAANMENNS